jgi:hypothetical protein
MAIVTQNNQNQQPEDVIETNGDNNLEQENVNEQPPAEQVIDNEQPVVDQSNIMMDYALLGHDKPKGITSTSLDEYEVPKTLYIYKAGGERQ